LAVSYAVVLIGLCTQTERLLRVLQPGKCGVLLLKTYRLALAMRARMHLHV